MYLLDASSLIFKRGEVNLTGTFKNNFLLAKFGDKEHLESLRDGTLYLNSVQNYRNDGTDYRGDLAEGAIPIDPQSIKMFDSDANNLFDKVPYPMSVNEYIQNDEDILMFCASAITKKILTKKDENISVLSSDFKRSIRSFGDYGLVFWSCDLLENLRRAQEKMKMEFGFESGLIIYRDLFDFSNEGSYYTSYKTTGNFTDRYFVKGMTYKNQNEWRLILSGSNGPLELNSKRGYTVQIGNLPNAVLYDSDTLLDTLQLCGKD